MKSLNKTKRNIVLLVLSLVLIIGSISPVSATKTNSGVVKRTASTAQKYSYMKLSDNYEELVTSENLTMSVDFESGLFAIKNNDNGYIWYSVPNNSEYDALSQGSTKDFSQSQVVVGYINKADEVDASRVSYLSASNVTDTNVTEIDNGIRVEYTYEIDLTASAATFEEGSEESVVEEEEKPAEIINVTIPVEFCLVEGKLSASVDIENVKQTDDIVISEFTLLPYFGAASWTEEGYIFVPDGSGALINFQGHHDDTSVYNQMVYGNDLAVQTEIKPLNTETTRMPVFGLANANDNAFVAIIEKGVAASSVEASPVSENKGYSTVSAKYNTKLLSQTTMFSKSSNVQTIYRLSDGTSAKDEFKVDYYILAGNDANYMGMAKKYRKYLEDNKILTKGVSEPTLNVDLYGGIDVKSNVLGVTYDKRESLTTYEQATEIVKTLKESGINDLSLRYIGWANDGVTNTKSLTSAKLMKVLGNKKSFGALTDYLNKNNIAFYPDVDLIHCLKGSNKSVAKTAFGETYYKYQYLRSVHVFDLTGNAKALSLPSLIDDNAKKYLKSYKKLGLENISLSTLTNTVYSSLKKGKTEYRTQTADILDNTLKEYKDAKLNIVGESANAYSFKYIDKIYKAPIYSSGYSCIDSEIPFYEIVLHGYISMTGDNMVQSINPATTYLKCIESGIELLWLGIYEECAELRDTRYDTLYGTTYTSWQNDALNKYNEYQPLLKKIYDKTIVNHEEVLKDVTVTEYDNGIKVYVNFSDNDVNIDGVVVSAQGFNYKEG